MERILPDWNLERRVHLPHLQKKKKTSTGLNPEHIVPRAASCCGICLSNRDIKAALVCENEQS